MTATREDLVTAYSRLMGEVFSVERVGASVSIERIKERAVEVNDLLRELNETEPLVRSVCRQDVSSTCNIARREFWERCAAHALSRCLSGQAAEEADKMLAEWEARWIAEEEPEEAEGREEIAL